MAVTEEARLASHMLVGSLIRRVQTNGGFAMILHKGDPVSGVILVQCLEKGRPTGLYERIYDPRSGYGLCRCGPTFGDDSQDVGQYIERRRRNDPDLWLIELDIAQAERLAAETIC